MKWIYGTMKYILYRIKIVNEVINLSAPDLYAMMTFMLWWWSILFVLFIRIHLSRGIKYFHHNGAVTVNILWVDKYFVSHNVITLYLTKRERATHHLSKFLIQFRFSPWSNQTLCVTDLQVIKINDIFHGTQWYWQNKILILLEILFISSVFTNNRLRRDFHIYR